MSAQDTNFYPKTIALFDGSRPAFTMGILNITKDSFYDGGNYFNKKDYLKKAEQIISEGAEIVDIGAQSTRPGASVLDENEESKRLIEAIASVRKEFPDIIISADTFRSTIAEKSIQAGADIINDISGGTLSQHMFEIVGKYNVPYILMHIQGTPQMMQINPSYNNVTKEVLSFFKKQINTLEQHNAKQIIIDPGFGFGKTMTHNFKLLNELETFKTINCPLLVGISRKSMIWKLLNSSPNKALNGTTVMNTIALMKGAKILRVHDVREAKEAIKIINEMNL